MKVCFLVGALTLSGGTYVIIQHAYYLKSKGYHVTLAIRENYDDLNTVWHDRLKQLELIRYHEATHRHYDLVIATWWKTALDLHRFSAQRYAYFVQSIESRFYPFSDTARRSLIEATYQLPVHYITEASWIKRYLKERYNQDAALVRNGIRKDLYQPTGNVAHPKTGLRVLVEGPLGVSFKNTAYALREARKANIGETWLLTSSPVMYAHGVSKVFSGIAIDAVPEIYRSCDILLKLSSVEGMFGSPLEMFHCGGTAIILDVSGADEYIVDGYNALVVSPDKPYQILESLKLLEQNPDKLLDLKQGASETASRWPSWNESSEMFRCWVDGVLRDNGVDDMQHHRSSTCPVVMDLAERITAAESRFKVDVDSKCIRTDSLRNLIRSSLRFLARLAPQHLVRIVKSIEYSLEIAFGGTRIR